MISSTEWQQIYVPDDTALTARLNAVFDRLETKPEKRIVMKPRLVLAVALIAMALLATIAVATGIFSGNAAAKNSAWRELKAAYGFTDELQSAFSADVARDGDATIVTYTPVTPALISDKLGVYTVQIAEGKASASWSLDGKANDATINSDVWDAKQLAQGVALRKAGLEWHEIASGGAQAPQTTQEQAVEIAAQALIAQFGEAALDGCTLDVHLCTGDTAHDLQQYWNVCYMRDGSTIMAVDVSAEDGAILCVTGAPTKAHTPYEAQLPLVRIAGQAICERYGLSKKALTLFKPWVEENGNVVTVLFQPEILDVFPNAPDSVWLKGNATNTLFSELIGSYAVWLTGDQVDAVQWSLGDVSIDPQQAWGAQAAYDAAALDRLHALLTAYQGITRKYVEDKRWNGLSMSIADAADRDALMRKAGFDEAVYNAVTPEAGMLSTEDALQTAAAQLGTLYPLSEDELSAAMNNGMMFCTCQSVAGKTIYTVWLYKDEGIYTVAMDASTGVIESVLFDSTLATNG